MSEQEQREWVYRQEGRGNKDGTLSNISTVLGKAAAREKIQVTCLDCGQPFDAIPWGPVTARVCLVCSTVRQERRETLERLAKEHAEEQRYLDLIRVAGVPPRWRDVRFDSLDPDIQPVAQKIARAYAEGFSKESPSLVLYSPGNGTGKTTLGYCIVNHLLHEMRVPVVARKARDVMLELRNTFSDRQETEAAVLNRVSYADLLFLDDVGKDPRSHWIYSTYWTLLDRRYDWQLPIVITTNKPIEGRGEVLADRIGEDAVSRLLGLCGNNVIDMTGVDLR